MNYWIIGMILFFSVLLQASVTTIPFTLIFLVLLFCLTGSDWMFPAAFVSGLFLDIVLVHSIGFTSVFFILILFLIFMYQKKFEITSYYFVFLALFMSVFFYTVVFGMEDVFFISFLSAVIGLVMYIWIFSQFVVRKKPLNFA